MNEKIKSIFIILIGLLFLTTTGMVAASSATTPTSPLFPVKKAIEAMTVAFAAPENKAAVQANILEKRITEIDTLKTKINALEKAQKLEQAKKLQDTVSTTKIMAKKAADKAKVNAQLMNDQAQKTKILEKVSNSEQQMNEQENSGSSEKMEPTEKQEVSEDKEIENENENENENESESENENESREYSEN